jgi:hypothetical protein
MRTFPFDSVYVLATCVSHVSVFTDRIHTNTLTGIKLVFSKVENPALTVFVRYLNGTVVVDSTLTQDTQNEHH